MDIQKQKNFIIKFTYVVLIGSIVYIALKFLLPLLMPFVISFIIASILRPIIRLITNNTNLNRTFISVTVLLAFYGLCIFLLISFGAKIFTSVSDIFFRLPEIYKSNIQPTLNTLFSKIDASTPNVNLALILGWDNISQSMMSLVASVSTNALNAIASIASKTPAFMLKLIITLIASFFFTFDYQKIVNFILKQFPEKSQLIINIKNSSINALLKLLKAYAILLSVTFIELLIGLNILRVENAFAISVIIALVDILPVLGTGSILTPWMIISLINGNINLAIGLLILYIIITVVRQILEPKVVGHQIGLYPLITLMCMFVGAQLFGIAGLFGFPIAATIIKNLHDNGIITAFK
ncbi:sporulation integral membrane protein YtvI [Clostridioides difficile]|nr:sporulation integral membrane protein YtvI [Clostridioides difficile]